MEEAGEEASFFPTTFPISRNAAFPTGEKEDGVALASWQEERQGQDSDKVCQKGRDEHQNLESVCSPTGCLRW